MEFIIFIIVVAVLFEYFQNKDKPTSQTENSNLDSSRNNIVARSNFGQDAEPTTVIHNHYTQNNVHIQNNYSGKVEAHAEHVWEKLGFEVKYGESYAYKHFGNEIYTEDQVRRITNQHNTRALTSQSYGRKKSYTRSKESETHTYDRWMELGYQVRKGERCISKLGRSYYFDRDQVAWVG